MPVVERIHLQSNKFAMGVENKGVENKGTGFSNLNDSADVVGCLLLLWLIILSIILLRYIYKSICIFDGRGRLIDIVVEIT